MQVGAVSDGITGVSTGVGNNLQVSVQTGASANLAGSQEMTGLVLSLNHLDLDSDGGGGVSLTTSASANAMDVAVGDGGLIDNVITQTASGPSVTARSQIEAANAQAGNLSIATTAAGNTAALNSVSGSLRGRITQTSSTDVLADGGAILGYTPGVAVVVGTAAGNNIDSTSVSGGSIDLTAVQANNASLTQASKFTAYGQVQSATTSATASGNNLNLVNEGTPTRVNVSQTNDSYVRAQAEGTAALYGDTTTMAYGVGNSSLVGGIGDLTDLVNDQVNQGGGVDVLASFGGTDGYDAFVSATAIGNAAIGYACSQCNGAINATSRQSNSTDVAASATLTATGTSRYVNAASSAIGNSASYYVSQPIPSSH